MEAVSRKTRYLILPEEQFSKLDPLAVKSCSYNMFYILGKASFKALNVFLLKIQRDLYQPKSFGKFEKRAPRCLEIWTLNF